MCVLLLEDIHLKLSSDSLSLIDLFGLVSNDLLQVINQFKQ